MARREAKRVPRGPQIATSGSNPCWRFLGEGVAMKPAALFTALCLSATAAAAQDQIERERQIFRALDVDGDARISREEARWGRELIEGLAQDSAGAGGTASPRAAPAPDLFRRLDRDRDGQLSDSE